MNNKAYSKILKRFVTHLTDSYGLSKRTRASYSKIIEDYLNYLAAFNVNVLNDAGQDLMLKFVKFKGEQKYAIAYVNLRLSALKTFYTWAYKNRLCSNHLILDFKKAKLNTTILGVGDGINNASETIILSDEELASLLKTMGQGFTEIRDKCIVELILASAMYAEEVVSLPASALSLKDGYIEIENTNRARRIPIDMSICPDSCKEWLRLRNEMLSAEHQCSFLFFSKDFAPLTKRNLHKIISQYLTRAGMKKERMGADVLRQTAIVKMFKQGKTLEEIQRITGIQTLASLEKYRRTVKIH